MEEKSAENAEETEVNIVEKIKALKPKAEKAIAFAKRHAVLCTLLLVLILQFAPNPGGNYPWGGLWLRLEGKNLPFAKGIAASSIDNYLVQQASSVVAQQYPNLPETNRKKVLDDVMKKLRGDYGSQLDGQRSRLEQEIREHYMYEANGQKFIYMSDIDPYHYLRLARNVIEKGYMYDEIKNGEGWDNHMLAPIGAHIEDSWHPYTLAFLYKVYSFSDKNVTLMEASKYFTIIFVLLACIFGFFITQKVAGNIGGMFTALAIGLLPAIMSRSSGGAADTDTYNVLFPILIVFFIVQALSSSSSRKQVLWAVGAGLATALHTRFWSGWWYLFDFIIGAIVISIGIEIVLNFRKGVQKIWTETPIKKFVYIGATFFLTSAVVTSIAIGPSQFAQGAFAGAISFTTIKDASLDNLWPNVLTTVAELNPSSLQGIMSSLGGQLMFLMGCLGIVLLLLKKEHGQFDVTHSILLTIWFIGTIYAALKGVRFILLLGPAFAVAFGASAGLLYQRISKAAEKQFHINKNIVGALVIILFGLIMIGPVKDGSHMTRAAHDTAMNDIPIVNDAWWNILTKIKNEGSSDAIINSWWDFGHHFKFIADRRVTFDGASQTTPQAHWIGKVLQTENEDEAIAILRMLDCGGNTAYDKIFEVTNDPYVSVNLVKQMIMTNKESAKALAQKAGISDITEFTHCDPPENYFITSADMIGKSGVWSHFGLWSFQRAEIWKKWRFIDEDEAILAMMKRFNLSEDIALQEYTDALALPSEDAANQWISPWLGYVGSPATCSKKGVILECGNVRLNLTEKRAEVSIDRGIALASEVITYDRKGNKTKTRLEGGNENLVIVMWPSGSELVAMPSFRLLAEGMFTRLFYMNGLGLKHFKPFTRDSQIVGGLISVWKVDWQGKEPYIPEDLLPKTSAQAGTEVAVNYIGWLKNGTVFDASITGWRDQNINPNSSFSKFKTQPLKFAFGQGKLIPGFEKGIEGMKVGDETVLEIAPADAYGIDPTKHALGNKTLYFKIKVVSVNDKSDSQNEQLPI